HLARRMRVRHLDDLAQRQRRDDVVGQLVQLAARLDLDDAAADELDPLDRRLEPHLPALIDDRVGHPLPHLAGAVARIVELRDQALDLVPLVAEDRRPRGREEREPLDALRGPLGANLRGRRAPHLLVVRLEEQLEQATAEAVRHPVLERVVDLVALRRGARVRGHAARELHRAELLDHVRAAQRVVEIAVVPVDARHARTQQELVAHHLVPEVVDLLRLGEEAVAVALDRLRKAADLVLGLEDDRVMTLLAEQVTGGETGRPAPQHEGRLGGGCAHERKGGPGPRRSIYRTRRYTKPCKGLKKFRWSAISFVWTWFTCLSRGSVSRRCVQITAFCQTSFVHWASQAR